ncbi:hypothetical protein GIB67_015202 [Kingdonia uniflora]|uniref:Symplekin C-terminal domain-containing protein n=1 Tax=Kingdonia uniflora TaxID=39325 RepID=A0A7J7MSM8_9MAGN|nr:hypothetical protein GIB67_015202 [Kingdonia uniflora]
MLLSYAAFAFSALLNIKLSPLAHYIFHFCSQSREKLIRALRTMNAGDAADQVIRKVDKLLKNADRASRDVRLNKVVSFSFIEMMLDNAIYLMSELIGNVIALSLFNHQEDPPSSVDLTRKRSMLQDEGEPNNIDEVPSKRPRYQIPCDSGQDDLTSNGFSSSKVSPLDNDLTPVEQMIAMIGALLAEGERGANSLEVLISNIHPDLMADIVIANMKHLPKSVPLASRLGSIPPMSLPTTSSSSINAAPTMATSFAPATTLQLPDSTSQVVSPIYFNFKMETSTDPLPNLPQDSKRDPRRDPRRLDPRRVPTPAEVQSLPGKDDDGDMQSGFDGSIGLSSPSLSIRSKKVEEVSTPLTLKKETEISECLVQLSTDQLDLKENLEDVEEGTEIVPVIEVKSTSDIALSSVHGVDQDPMASTISDIIETFDVSYMSDSDQRSPVSLSTSAPEEISYDLPLPPIYIELTEEQQNTVRKLAVTRIFDSCKKIQATGYTQTRMALLARLVAQIDDDGDIAVMLEKHTLSTYESQKDVQLYTTHQIRHQGKENQIDSLDSHDPFTGFINSAEDAAKGRETCDRSTNNQISASTMQEGWENYDGEKMTVEREWIEVQKGHELAMYVLYYLHAAAISGLDDLSSSVADTYEKFLVAVAKSLRDKLPASDKSFSRFLGEVPLLPDSALTLLEHLCYSEGFDNGKGTRDSDRITQGLGAVWSLILARPLYREACLNIALKCAVHMQEDVRAKAIRLVANKLYPLNYLSERIERFATKILMSVVDQQVPEAELLQETSISGSQNSEPGTSEDEYTKGVQHSVPAVSLSQAQRCMSLFFALCTKNPSLLQLVFDTYGRAPKTIKQAVHRHIPILVKNMGSSYSDLLYIISNPPLGSENLLLLVLQILTEETTPSADLIATVKHLYETKLKDAAILIPMLSLLPKDEVLPIFPRLVDLPLEKFQIALARILQVMEACSACFEQRTVFTEQVLAKALNQLVDHTPLPLIFMRTVIQAIDAYPSMVDFVMDILSKLVSKQIWKMPKLWVGFLKCMSQTQPHSFRVLLKLPPPQLEIALNKHNNLRSPLAAYASQTSIRSSLPRSILVVLGFTHESHMQQRPVLPNSLHTSDTSSSVHGAMLT